MQFAVLYHGDNCNYVFDVPDDTIKTHVKSIHFFNCCSVFVIVEIVEEGQCTIRNNLCFFLLLLEAILKIL